MKLLDAPRRNFGWRRRAHTILAGHVFYIESKACLALYKFNKKREKVMKKVLIFIGSLAVIALLLHVSLFVFINVKGKEILVTAVKDNVGIDADVKSLTLRFPFILEIEDFSCKGLSFQKARASLGAVNPFAPKVILNKVLIEGLDVEVKKEKARLSIEAVSAAKSALRAQSAKKAPPEKKDASTRKASLSEEKSDAVKPAPGASKKSVSLTIKELHLKDGLVQVSDATGKKPLKFSLQDIDLKLRNFTYPRLTKCYIDLRSSLKAGHKEIKDVIKVKGWVDYFNKSMDINLNAGSMDYFSFSGYYPESWRNWSSVIEDAVLSLDSNLAAKSNDLVIDTVISLDRIAFKDFPETEENAQAIARVKTMKTVVAFLGGSDDSAQLRFKIKTKMDKPKLDFSSIKNNIKGIVQVGPITIIGEAIKKVKDQAEKKVKNGKDISVDTVEEAIKGAVDIFKGIFKDR